MKKEEVDTFMKMKQAFALLCAGTMVITGSAFPVNVQASAEWVWNAEVSESGYVKVPHTELTTTADTEANNESSTGAGAASPGTGHAVNATDGVITSYYHSSYSGDKQPNRENGTLTGNNTITVELQDAQSIKGITYLPRQDAFGNGTVTEFNVSVQKDGSENWESVGENFHITYDNPSANWSAENKSEKEFVFGEEVENVKKVKLTVIHTDGSAPNQHISAAEISVLTPAKKDVDVEVEALKNRIREKLTQIEVQMELNVLDGKTDSGKVYSRAEFDPIKADAEAKLDQESPTKEELESVYQQLEQFKMKFQDELGTGVYVSDLTHLSGTTAWGGVQKDRCPDGNRLIAIKKDASAVNTYTKGIGAHEPSTIIYDVTGYKMFSADIGVENHQIGSDGGAFANVKAKFKVSTSTDGSNYTEQYYAEDLTANGGLRSIRVKLPEGTTRMKLECPASAWSNGSGGKLHTCWANAKLYETVEIAVAEITLDQDTLALKVGGTEEQKKATLLATITPADATSQDVLWESDNDAVVTVEDGVVTAHKAGNATITVSSADYPAVTAQCAVTVIRDNTELDATIKAAEAKMQEENFAQKYTGASIKALEEDLADAKDAKGNADLSVEEVKLIVESLKASIEGLQLKAVVTIRNNGTEETKYCEIGDQVRVVAQKVAGKKFSHWIFNETPICYSSPYTFTVYGDTTIEAVYVDAEEVVTPQAAMMCSVSYNKSTQTIKFTAKRSVPEGCKIVKHGMILTSKPAWDALYKDNQEAFKLEANRIITKVATTTGLVGNYSVNVKCTKPNIWYAKGYVVYTDKSGEEQTVYSNVVSYEVK